VVLENPKRYAFETKPDGSLANSQEARTLILAVRRAKISILRGKMGRTDNPLVDDREQARLIKRRKMVEQFLDDQGRLSAADREATDGILETFESGIERDMERAEFDDPRSFATRAKAYGRALVQGALDGSTIGIAWKMGKTAVALGVGGAKWAIKLGAAVPTGGLSLIK